jgi:undecaprenyl phosphate N,N'-diacetylbacillosamine 1-phosphate transferase
MSFIEPRPLIVKYLPLYNEEQKKRNNVKPGISGLTQVKGRNQITWKVNLNRYPLCGKSKFYIRFVSAFF